jgi:hypothetical protein
MRAAMSLRLRTHPRGHIKPCLLLEWHRWFAWYPVPVVRKGNLRYAWLRFVERKWGTSRYSGTMKWRYRLLSARVCNNARTASEPIKTEGEKS